MIRGQVDNSWPNWIVYIVKVHKFVIYNIHSVVFMFPPCTGMESDQSGTRRKVITVVEDVEIVSK